MYILFDIGGTKMRIAGSPDGSTFTEPVIVPTPREDFEEGVRLFVETAHTIAGEEEITAIAGGLAGPLNREKTMLVNAPNIPGWNGQPFKTRIEEALGASMLLENDAAVVGLGEAVAGAGKEYEIVAYITTSTGVGGARIVNKKIDTNRFGFEIGHSIINHDDVTPCVNCGGAGHIEGYISGTAFSKMHGKPAGEVTDEAAWDRAAEIFAAALANIAVFWSPDVIVAGGSMIVGAGEVMPMKKVHDYFRKKLTIFEECPELKKAELQSVGGLHGALELLRQKIAISQL